MEQHWCSTSNKFQQPETPAAISINPTSVTCHVTIATVLLVMFCIVQVIRGVSLFQDLFIIGIVTIGLLHFIAIHNVIARLS